MPDSAAGVRITTNGNASGNHEIAATRVITDSFERFESRLHLLVSPQVAPCHCFEHRTFASHTSCAYRNGSDGPGVGLPRVRNELSLNAFHSTTISFPGITIPQLIPRCPVADTSAGYPRSHARNALQVRAGLTYFLVTATSVTPECVVTRRRTHVLADAASPADAVLVVMSNTRAAAAQTISAMSPTPAEKLHTIGREGTSEKVKGLTTRNDRFGWVAPQELVEHARTPVRSSGVARQHESGEGCKATARRSSAL